MKKKYRGIGVYVGDSKGFFSPVRHGYGSMRFNLSYADGDKSCVYYVGEWKDDKISGRGTMTYKNGGKYEGVFEAGKRVGGGTYYGTYGNIIEYESQSSSHGKGKETFTNGSYYIGEFVGDQANGRGAEYNPKGELIFEGNFRSGLRSYGTYYDREADYVYEGGFYGNEFHGKGKIRYGDGRVAEGVYYGGAPTGVFKITMPDGTVTTKDYSKKATSPAAETTASFVKRVAEALNSLDATAEEKRAMFETAKEMYEAATRAGSNAEASGKKFYLKDCFRDTTPKIEEGIAKKNAEKAKEIAKGCAEHSISLGEYGQGNYRGEMQYGLMHGYGVFTCTVGEVAGWFQDGRMASVVIKSVNGGYSAGYHAPDGSFSLGVQANRDMRIAAQSRGSLLDGVGEVSIDKQWVFHGYIKGDIEKANMYLDGITVYDNGCATYGTTQFDVNASIYINKVVKIKYTDGTVRYGKRCDGKYEGYCIDEKNGSLSFMLFRDGKCVKTFEKNK